MDEHSIESSLRSLYRIGSRISHRFGNKYYLVFIVFIVWMVFFDSDSFYRQFKRSLHIKKIEKEIDYYQEKLVETNEEQRALNNNPEYFEKFVREKYLFKREGEDLFVFTED